MTDLVKKQLLFAMYAYQITVVAVTITVIIIFLAELYDDNDRFYVRDMKPLTAALGQCIMVCYAHAKQ